MENLEKQALIGALNEALMLLRDPDASIFDADRLEALLCKVLSDVKPKIYSIYVLDRANQLTEYKYSSQLDADNASDDFEAQGHDVFSNMTRAIEARDRYARFFIKQHRLSN